MSPFTASTNKTSVFHWFCEVFCGCCFYPFSDKWLQLSIRLWLLLFFRSAHSLCLSTFKDKRMSTIRQEDKRKWCSLVYKIIEKAWNRAWDLKWKQQPRLWALQWNVLLIRVASTTHGCEGGPVSLLPLCLGWVNNLLQTSTKCYLKCNNRSFLGNEMS